MIYNKSCVRLKTCIYFVNYWKHKGDSSPENHCVFWWINCKGEASTSLCFSMSVVQATWWWWPKLAEMCSRWQKNSCVRRVVFALKINTDWLTNKTWWWYQNLIFHLICLVTI